jgi:hypothetical protein
MPDSLDAPDPELNVPEGASLLSAISREMVKAMKTYYGRGPTKAKSYLVDDLLFIVMRGGGTEAEKTMLEAGEHDPVREFRQRSRWRSSSSTDRSSARRPRRIR